uniref:Aminopeptidase N n=1 Tax=Octactis speculum TaxID=3111310 RepID=A0A7S2AUA2_9STRA
MILRVMSFVFLTRMSSTAARRSAPRLLRNSVGRSASAFVRAMPAPKARPWGHARYNIRPLALMSAVVTDEKAKKETPVEKYRKDYKPLPWTVERIDLEFDLHDGTEDTDRATRVTSSVLMTTMGAAEEGYMELDCEDIELESVAIDGTPVTDYTLENDKLRIPVEWMPSIEGKEFTLATVSLLAPASNLQLSGLYKSSGMFCTQCEAEGFRRITPYFDRPDVMTRYRVRVEGDKEAYPVLLSNGNLVESGSCEDDSARHYTVWEDPFPKPSYLFAVVAGNLGSIKDTYTTTSGTEVALQIFSEHANVDQLEHAMTSLKKSMAWDETRYGLEYDLGVYNIVAVNDFNMGAMENKGLNVFNTALTLAKPETATDADYERIESVIGHEYFHNWSGNRVTCRDWFQLTLKEGLTVYRDQEFSADMGSRPVCRINDVRSLRARQFPEDGGPMAHPIRPESYIAMDNFYTSTVYEKGAEVIRMYENLVGRDGFRSGLDLYFKRHDGQAVTCDDFRDAMSAANDRDMSQFERWYTQAGTPVVTAEGSFDEQKQTYSLTLSQRCSPSPGQPDKLPFHIPFKVGLLDAATGTEVLETQTLELTDSKQTFVLPLSDESLKVQDVVPSLLRDFSSPVRLEYDMTDESLSFLMAHDSDPFNKWEAAQKLATRVILAEAEGGQGNVDALVEAFGLTLSATDLDLSLQAYALTLPSTSELLDACSPPVDPIAVLDARKNVKQALAKAHEAELITKYEALSAEEMAESFSLKGSGRRLLRNVILDCLNSLGDEGSAARAFDQFTASSSMTDRLAALTSLVGSEVAGDRREQALEQFYTAAEGDALVINKWFSTQASADVPDALNMVKTKLLEHPDFTWSNPNRMRSVVAVFAGGNIRGFHAADGSGYEFLGDCVLQVDTINNQIAARLCGALSLWRRYDESRGGMMRTQLERIRDHEGLSKDVYEIASRSLA